MKVCIKNKLGKIVVSDEIQKINLFMKFEGNLRCRFDFIKEEILNEKNIFKLSYPVL